MRSTWLAILLTTSLLLGAALSGCAPSKAGNVYTREQARTSHTVYYGTIMRLEEVTIEGSQSGLGTLAGGAMGGVLGSGVGSGSGKAIAVVGGAIVGALAGSAVEKGATGAAGIEIEVMLDSGEGMLVVQENTGEFAIGDRVRVIKSPDGTTRVRQ